jgi:hypothetical protein
MVQYGSAGAGGRLKKEISNYKHQITNKSQAPNSKRLELRSFEFGIYLDFVIWQSNIKTYD